MKWQTSAINPKMTIVVVAHNLVSLCYPFIESFYSALPLGCNFLVGNYGCTDSTMDVFKTLSNYAPIAMVNGRWQPETGGTAIGIATQELLSQCTTPLVLNLQACEILCEDGIQSLLANPQPASFRTRHFWGNFYFDGSQGYGYGEAPRVYSNQQKGLDQGDGCWPPGGFNHVLWPIVGTLHRYSYCFDNQVAMKAANHYKLYLNNAQTPEQRKNATEWCKQHPNYHGPHPECVAHLKDQANYDIMRSWDILSKTMEFYKL